MIPQLRNFMFLVAALLDAIAIIGVAMGLYFIFANPFSSEVKAAMATQATQATQPVATQVAVK